MVNLKLNENYSNTFLTTVNGESFFRDWIKQKQPEYVEIKDDFYNKSIELKSLVKQGILIKKKEDIKEEIKKEIKEELKNEVKEEVKEEVKKEPLKKEVKKNIALKSEEKVKK